MKKPILFGTILSVVLLSACGTVDEPTGSVTNSSESDTTSFTDESSADDDSVPVSPVNNVSGTYDKFYQFMLASTDDKNAVFSSESLNSAFCLYGALLDDTDSAAVRDFVNNIDYLSYQNTPVFKITNRLWVNSIHDDFNTDAIDLPDDLIYKIDMSDSAAATEEKNAYVKEQTNGFISSTPSIFDSSMLFDAMNVIYFKDTWFNGDKDLTDEPVAFHNIDGTDIDITMIEEHTSDACIMQSDDACAYTMEYGDGFTFTAILPNEGRQLSDISIDSFVSCEAESVYYDHVNFYMPEFETESFYTCGLDSFGLTAENIDPNIYNGDTDLAVVMQVAKIRVDHTGTEAAAISEIIKDEACAIEEEPTVFDMVCDRPFAYYIYDTVNNDVAFMGVVTSCN